MADALRLPTVRLLTHYLEYCSRAAGTAALPPSMPEASVLRSVAAQVQRRYQLVWSCYCGYHGNRIELMEQEAQETLHDRRVPSWGRVVALISFAGTLMERPPPGRRLELKAWEADDDRDCQNLVVALLCDWLTGQPRAWLEATRRLGERGHGTLGGAGIPGTRSCDGHLADPVAPAFQHAGTLSVYSSFLFWRSQAGRNRPF